MDAVVFLFYPRQRMIYRVAVIKKAIYTARSTRDRLFLRSVSQNMWGVRTCLSRVTHQLRIGLATDLDAAGE